MSACSQASMSSTRWLVRGLQTTSLLKAIQAASDAMKIHPQEVSLLGGAAAIRDMAIEHWKRHGIIGGGPARLDEAVRRRTAELEAAISPLILQYQDVARFDERVTSPILARGAAYILAFQGAFATPLMDEETDQALFLFAVTFTGFTGFYSAVYPFGEDPQTFALRYHEAPDNLGSPFREMKPIFTLRSLQDLAETHPVASLNVTQAFVTPAAAPQTGFSGGRMDPEVIATISIAAGIPRPNPPTFITAPPAFSRLTGDNFWDGLSTRYDALVGHICVGDATGLNAITIKTAQVVYDLIARDIRAQRVLTAFDTAYANGQLATTEANAVGLSTGVVTYLLSAVPKFRKELQTRDMKRRQREWEHDPENQIEQVDETERRAPLPKDAVRRVGLRGQRLG
ncbi:hypothetical protein K491DRAFT_780061 [Lophiostoma macrostomum CBS 122681]|uniref:Uncharacterized protein n=1 Tax=Lophiostoma macrostomum CBS 122681 TaxID=1314788 RepID=A0A6A6T119_9PLEO|nr:hypothetical protein K491DRAFT_780061 [Lophiostoma macrostomum CBS 122681]